MENKYTQWEQRLLPCLLSNIEKIKEELQTTNNKVFFDIGANVGLITEHLLPLFSDWEYYLFEPVKDYADYCSEKFKNYPNVKVFNIALSDFNGETFISKCCDNLGWNTISTLQDYGTKEKVQTRTLDSIISAYNIKEIGFIKIDVEQYESYVIKGGKDFFTTCKELPKILVEVIKNGHPCWEKNCEMFEFLFNVGYNRLDYQSSMSANDIFLTK